MKNKLLHIDMIELINRAAPRYCLRQMANICFGTWSQRYAFIQDRMRAGRSLLIWHRKMTQSLLINTAVSIFQKRLQIRSQNGIVLHQQRYIELFTANGFNETVECRQAVYTNKEKLSVSGLYRPDGKPMPKWLNYKKAGCR